MCSVETITETGTEQPKANTGKRAKKTKTASPKNQTKAKAKQPSTRKDAKTSAKNIKTGDAREGSKKAVVLELLRRKEGATIAEIAKATDWQSHSIRGFISGTIMKKMGLKVESEKNESGERTYRLAT